MLKWLLVTHTIRTITFFYHQCRNNRSITTNSWNTIHWLPYSNLPWRPILLHTNPIHNHKWLLRPSFWTHRIWYPHYFIHTTAWWIVKLLWDESPTKCALPTKCWPNYWYPCCSVWKQWNVTWLLFHRLHLLLWIQNLISKCTESCK